MDLLPYALLAFAPAGSPIAFAAALEWWTRGNGGTRSGAGVPGPEIERLVADLRQLECDYCRIERSDLFDGIQRPEMETSLAQCGVTW